MSTAPQTAPENPTADLWSSVGAQAEYISQSLSDALLHCINRILPFEKGTILDIGCATGLATRMLQQKLIQAKIVGVDIAPWEISRD